MLCCFISIAHGVVGEAPGPCAGKRLDGPAVDVLRGAHLKVLELEWSPFAYKDPAARHGWSGAAVGMAAFSAARGISLRLTVPIASAP